MLILGMIFLVDSLQAVDAYSFIQKSEIKKMRSSEGSSFETVALLPAYNLEDSIAEVVHETRKFVDIVIVVSDGSRDNTNLMAKEAGAMCPPIH